MYTVQEFQEALGGRIWYVIEDPDGNIDATDLYATEQEAQAQANVWAIKDQGN